MLPPLSTREEVQRRLGLIFPEGAPRRNYCTREMAASTVFVMLYIGAVEGLDRFLGPKHVYRMSDEQAEQTGDASRFEYSESALKPGSVPDGQSWYADTTREPIRDETIRQGFIPVGAVLEKKRPTTSPKPRYYLASDFAILFAPELDGEELQGAISEWREAHLTPAALARVELIRSGASVDPDDFLVTFPNGETQRLTPGESSVITKAVIEAFAPRFLQEPHVIWVSESGNKVVVRHELHAKRLGLDLHADKLLPDIILVDMASMTIVFVEVVATDGPVDEQRRSALLSLVTEAGHHESNTAFVTAFMTRTPSMRKHLGVLAWNSFAWIASEPLALISLERHEDKSEVWLHKRLGGAGEGRS